MSTATLERTSAQSTLTEAAPLSDAELNELIGVAVASEKIARVPGGTPGAARAFDAVGNID